MYDEDGLSSVSFWKVTFSLLMRMEKNMDTKHISEMEAILDEANEILDTLDKNLNRLNDIQAKIQKLENYYTSKQWIDDFTADEQGLLPQALKRGVLSEDGISSMLERNKDYMERIIQR